MKILGLVFATFMAGCATNNSTLDEERAYMAAQRANQQCYADGLCISPNSNVRYTSLTPEQKAETKEERNKRLSAAAAKNEELHVIAVQRQKDLDICNYEAVKATASGQRGYTVYSTIFNDVGDTFRQAELIQLCMKSKGY